MYDWTRESENIKIFAHGVIRRNSGLTHLPGKGHQLELEGTKELDGKEVHVLKLTKKSGNVDRYYLDKKSYMVVRTETTGSQNGMQMEVISMMSDYRDVGGYMMPFSTEIQAGGQGAMKITFEKVESDIELDDSLFSIPE